MTPAHYRPGGVTPWDLQRNMTSSGDCFVDARRTDAIEYCFRIKEDLLADLKKARHCLEAAIAHLEQDTNRDTTQPQPRNPLTLNTNPADSSPLLTIRS